MLRLLVTAGCCGCLLLWLLRVGWHLHLLLFAHVAATAAVFPGAGMLGDIELSGTTFFLKSIAPGNFAAVAAAATVKGRLIEPERTRQPEK